MNDCKLCLSQVADETGSHLIPHFLLKRVVNVEGKTGRDQEMGFSLETTTSSSNFGRSVSIEKLHELYGENIDEEDLKNNIDPHVVDNYFCKDCEKRFATIESNYSNFVNNPEIKCKGNYALLFWSSIFWRMSVSKRYGQFFRADQEEKLRGFLDKYLNKDIDQVPESLDNEQIHEFGISSKTLRCNNYSGNNPTHILFHPEFFSPYMLLLDEFLVAIAFNNDFSDLENQDFFGIQEEILNSKSNIGVESEDTSQIDQQQFTRACNGVIDKIKERRAEFIDKSINAVAQYFGYGETMPEHLAKLIYKEITSDEKPLARKYTFQDMSESIFTVLSKFPPPGITINN